VINSFSRAVETLPNRDSRKDPILEPHYKLVSIVHKLVSKGVIQPKDASELLKVSCYVKKLDVPEDLEQWENYVLSVLKTLRNADKSGWHHRMTARVSFQQMIYWDTLVTFLGCTNYIRWLWQRSGRRSRSQARIDAIHLHKSYDGSSVEARV
jgi:hypothetical protein